MSAIYDGVNMRSVISKEHAAKAARCWLSFVLWFAFTSVAAAADGVLRTEQGRYLTLTSDVADADLKHYVQAFDQAVPLWQAYWHLNDAQLDQWHLQGYLMSSKQAFSQHGLLPGTLPNFLNGFQRDHSIWVINQPSPYYTLHLILHEGVHGLSQHAFGGGGAPWYMEGSAEYLATHVEDDAGNIQVGIIPANRQASPFWGRIGLIEDSRKRHQIPTIQTVMRYGLTAHLNLEPYAWSWCAAVLMEMYPEYRSVYREASSFAREPATPFTRQVYQRLATEWPVLEGRWLLLTHDLDYGFDVQRNQVELQSDWVWLDNDERSLELAADKGWQAVPVRVKAGDKVNIQASGTIQLRNDPAWTSNADGVTITYYRGRPLAKLLACVLPSTSQSNTVLPELQIEPVGAGASVVAQSDGWLLFKINDHPGELSDNSGALKLDIRKDK